MTDDQVADIKANKEKLMASAQQLFQKVYEQAQQSQTSAGAENGGSNPDDGVVDGDSRKYKKTRRHAGAKLSRARLRKDHDGRTEARLL